MFDGSTESVALRVQPGFTATPDEAVAAVRPACLFPDGRLRLGVLSLLTDMTCGFLSHRSVQPDWTVTTQMRVSIADPTGVADTGLLEVEGRVLRVGRHTTSGEGTVRLDGRTVGHATAAFQRLSFRPGNPEVFLAEEVHHEVGDSRLGSSWGEAIGEQVVDPDAGIVEVEVRPAVHNPLGAFHGGLLTTPMETAALTLCSATNGGHFAAMDLDVRYLAMTRSGVVRAVPQIAVAGESGRHLVRVELRDGDAVATVAWVTCVRVEG